MQSNSTASLALLEPIVCQSSVLAHDRELRRSWLIEIQVVSIVPLVRLISRVLYHTWWSTLTDGDFQHWEVKMWWYLRERNRPYYIQAEMSIGSIMCFPAASTHKKTMTRTVDSGGFKTTPTRLKRDVTSDINRWLLFTSLAWLPILRSPLPLDVISRL